MKPLELSSDQREFQNSIRTFLEGEVTANYIKKRFEGNADPDLKIKLSQLGLPQAFATEADGGVGFGIIELTILAHEAGRALIPENIVENAYAVWLLSNKRKEFNKLSDLISDDELSKILSGKLSVSFAPLQDENKKIGYISDVENSAWVISFSETSFNINRVEKFKTLDSLDHFTKLGEQTASNEISGNDENIYNILLLLKSAELSGIAEQCVSMTSEYAKTRKQFGSAIGAFQAVQHRLADMHLQAESSKALAHFAAWSAESSPTQLSLAANSAMLYAAKVTPTIIEAAIQLHGGIGFTWEYPLHLYLRRALTLVSLWGEEKLQISKILNSVAAS